VFEFQLKIAVAAQDQLAQFGKMRAAPAFPTHRLANERRGPAAVHSVHQHPRATIIESKPSSRFGDRAAGANLLKQVRARFGYRGLSCQFHPEPSPNHGTCGSRSSRHGYASSSVETMTSVALITATAGFPFLSRSRLAEDVLMSETI